MSPVALATPLTNSIAVASSSWATLAYDEQCGILQVEFLDRTLYQYIAVPRKTYEELCRAESKGAHFNRHIRNRFAWVKLPAV
jgi:KTSC domain